LTRFVAAAYRRLATVPRRRRLQGIKREHGAVLQGSKPWLPPQL
jgi:hypothetical protein